MQQPRIVELTPTPLIGLRSETSLSENITASLWKDFKKQIKVYLPSPNPLFYSVQQFNPADFDNFNSETRFIKWAAVRKQDLDSIPHGMSTITLQGMHVVFIHAGLHADFGKTTQHIFGTWLPASDFLLDDRPHFEVMDERYLGPMNPASVEEIWIPIKKRTA